MNIKFIDVDSAHILGAYSLIKKGIYECKTISRPVVDTKYHHHTLVENVPLIIENGILSKESLAKIEGRVLTSQEEYRGLDDYHVNGLDSISLSSMDVDFSRKREKEYVYDSYDTIEADIIVSKEVKTIKNTINYFNEFLVSNRILPEQLNAIDLRILKIFDYDFHDLERNKIDSRIRLMVKKYNTLRNIALALEESNLNIPIREVSNEIITLSPQKILRLPHIIIK